MCLAQGHNAMHPVRVEPANSRSRVKRSTTEPLCFCYHLTSTGAEAVVVRSVGALATSLEEADIRIILHCIHTCGIALSTTHITV